MPDTSINLLNNMSLHQTQWSQNTKIGVGVATTLLLLGGIAGIVGGVGVFGSDYSFTGSYSWIPITSSIVTGSVTLIVLYYLKNWYDWSKICKQDLMKDLKDDIRLFGYLKNGECVIHEVEHTDLTFAHVKHTKSDRTDPMYEKMANAPYKVVKSAVIYCYKYRIRKLNGKLDVTAIAGEEKPVAFNQITMGELKARAAAHVRANADIPEAGESRKAEPRIGYSKEQLWESYGMGAPEESRRVEPQDRSLTDRDIWASYGVEAPVEPRTVAPQDRPLPQQEDIQGADQSRQVVPQDRGPSNEEIWANYGVEAPVEPRTVAPQDRLLPQQEDIQGADQSRKVVPQDRGPSNEEIWASYGVEAPVEPRTVAPQDRARLRDTSDGMIWV